LRASRPVLTRKPISAFRFELAYRSGSDQGYACPSKNRPADYAVMARSSGLADIRT
jgi:hypothetical protein